MAVAYVQKRIRLIGLSKGIDRFQGLIRRLGAWFHSLCQSPTAELQLRNGDSASGASVGLTTAQYGHHRGSGNYGQCGAVTDHLT